MVDFRQSGQNKKEEEEKKKKKRLRETQLEIYLADYLLRPV